MRLIYIFVCLISITTSLNFQDPPLNLNFTFPRPDVGPINVFYPYITRLMDVAWQSVNDQVLREYQLQFAYVNDFNDVNTTKAILRNILYNESMYFLPCCLGYGTLMLEIMAQEFKTLPLVAPLDITDELRNLANYSQVINLLASETEEVATIISYLTLNLQLSRIGYYGDSGNVASLVNQTLDILGRRLVVYREFISTVTSEDMTAIVAAAPEAIILTTEAGATINFIPQLRSFSVTNETIVIIPSAQSTTGALNFVLSTEATTRNVLAIASTPTWTNISQPETSLIGMLQQDLAKYDSSLLADAAPFGFVPGTNEVHAYLAIQWLARIVDTIPATNFSSDTILEAVYSHSVQIIGDQIVGPFLDDCQSILGCCNQGAHAIYINKLVPNVLGSSDYVQVDTVTWPGCTASPENQPLPFVLGMVQDLTSENLVLAEGIRLAVADKVAEAAFNGRGAILLTYDTLIGDLDELTTELIDTDNALALLGQLNDLTHVDNITVWSLRPNEVTDQANIIRLFPSLYDQLFAAVSDISGKEFELITEDSELMTQAETLAKELKLKLVSSGAQTVIIYRSDYAQIIADRSDDDLYLLGLIEPAEISPIPSTLKLVLVAPNIADTSNLVILNDYLQSTNNSSQLGFMAYITGRFFSRVLESINGPVTADRILDTVYQLGVISEAGLATGKLSRQPDDFCTKGFRELYLVAASTMNTTSSITWSGCEARPTTSSNGDGDNGNVAIATGVSLAGLFLLCCGCLLLVCLLCSCLLLLVIISASTIKRRVDDTIKLTPPDYYTVAFNPEFLDATEAQASLIYDYDFKRSELAEVLNLFEQLLLNEPYTEVLIKVLDRKFGKGRQLAAWLLYIFRYQGQEIELVRLLSKLVVDKVTTVTTMFREDSILARTFKVYCQLEGLPFLWHKLARVTNEIQLAATGERKLNIKMPDDAELFDLEMEVDPLKAEDKTEADLAVNSYQLKALAQRIFNATTEDFPESISGFVKLVIETVIDKFPDVEASRLQVLAGSFVFLRYVCPAIAAPQMWGLLEDAPCRSAQRTLILLSKIIQNLANARTFDKEAYMTNINDFITSNQDRMTDFLNGVIYTDMELESSGLEVSETVHTQTLKLLLSVVIAYKDDISSEFAEILSDEDLEIVHNRYLIPLNC